MSDLLYLTIAVPVAGRDAVAASLRPFVDALPDGAVYVAEHVSLLDLNAVAVNHAAAVARSLKAARPMLPVEGAGIGG